MRGYLYLLLTLLLTNPVQANPPSPAEYLASIPPQCVTYDDALSDAEVTTVNNYLDTLCD